MKKYYLFIMTIALSLATMIIPTHATSKTGVAMVHDVEYASLQEAVDAVEANTETEIVLLDDIVMNTEDIVTISGDKVIRLNMAQHKITVSDQFIGRPLINEGILIVYGDGVIDSHASIDGYGAINNMGSLTIKDGTYRGYKYGDGSVIRNTGRNAFLEIENGLFEMATSAIYNEGRAVIHGGVFKGDTCSQCNGEIWSYTIRNVSVDSYMVIYGGSFYGVQGAVSASVGYLEIHDGYFKTEHCHENENHTATFYALYAAGEAGEVELNVYGGTFETEGSIAAVVVGNDNTGGDGGINAKATANIYGGSFIAPAGVTALKGAVNTGDPMIYGGSFTSKPNSHYFSSDFDILEDNGMFIVYPKATAIHLQNPDMEIAVGDHVSLLYQMEPSDTLDSAVHWTVADETVAVVDEHGTLRALKEGDTIVTVTSSNGLSDSMKVHVVQNYTVSFMEDGSLLSQTTIRSGETIEQPENPIKEGYQFMGWYRGEQNFDFDTPIVSDMVLTAQWKHIDGAYHIVSDKVDVSQSTEDITAYFVIDERASAVINESLPEDIKNLISECLAAGKDVTTKVVIEQTAVETVNEQRNRSTLAEALRKQEQLIVMQYLDAHIQILCEQQLLGELTATKEPLEFHISLPKQWRKEGRTFYVMQEQKGNIVSLETKEKDGILSFYTADMTTFALVYQEQNDKEVINKDADETIIGSTDLETDNETTVQDALTSVDSDSPNTGDTTALLSYSVLTILCMIVLVKWNMEYSSQKH